MSITTRTDIHRPSAINPSAYEYVGCEYCREGHEDAYRGDADHIEAHFVRTGGQIADHKHGHECHVCGSVSLIYSILYYHAPSNEYIRVGEDCAHKLGLKGTEKFNAFKKAVREYAEVYAGKQKAQRILAEAGLTALWEIAFAEDRKGFAYEENTITDIVGKLIRYGSVSDKALAFAASLIGKIEKRAEVAAQRAAEDAAAAPCPSGRVQVTGTILSAKERETDWGTVTKILVRDDRGFKVWCSFPRCADVVERGSRISFKVTLTPSDDDPKFGFGKRPSNWDWEITQDAAANH